MVELVVEGRWRQDAPMALDAEIARIVRGLGERPYLDLAALPAEQALAIARPAPPAFGPVSPRLKVRDERVPVQGGAIDVRCYIPDAKGPFPIVVHLHGGGWVSGSLQQEDWRCQFVALDAACVVVSVGYRLSPETQFPAPIHDCRAAWDWARDNASAINGDAARMAVSGSSAGGQLAVALMALLRRDGEPMPVFQLQTYPALDPGLASESYRDYADGPFMTKARMAWYWGQYLGAADRADPLLDFLSDLSGFPPALVQVAEFDVLRDEAVAYAERLLTFEIPAVVSLHRGMIHGFIAIAPEHRQSTIALEEGCQALRATFA
jgi:acetyl esterase